MKSNKYTHRDHIDFMQRAAEEYYKDELGDIPPMDYNFMQLDKSVSKKRKITRRVVAIAGVVIFVFLCGNIISVSWLDAPAYGEKGLLHRIYQSIRGIDTDEQNQVMENEILEEFEITSMADIDGAIDFSEGTLYIPESIPEGYELELLSMKDMSLGDFTASYTFKKGEEKLIIAEVYSDRGEEVSCTGDGELIKLDDRIIYFQDKDSESNVYVNVYTEDALIQISGKISEEEAIEVAKNINKAKLIN